MRKTRISILFGLLIMVMLPALQHQTLFAHCDSLDGPVIISAKEAIKTGDVNLILHWIPQADETEIKTVFKKTMEVRKTSAVAKELADTFFFETLVRIHRAGEGAPYTGLKPAGGINHAVMSADQSLENGSIDKLAKAVAAKVEQGIRLRFQQALKKKKAAGKAGENVEKGREAVVAYVEYVHFIDGIHKIASADTQHDHAKKEEKQPKHSCGHK